MGKTQMRFMRRKRKAQAGAVAPPSYMEELRRIAEATKAADASAKRRTKRSKATLPAKLLNKFRAGHDAGGELRMPFVGFVFRP
jgi:hypothetical protein